MATVKQILDMANSQLGTKEFPANSNNVKYNTDYYGRAVNGSAYPWCAVFCWWIFNQCNASDLFCSGKKVAYTPTIAEYYKLNNKWFTSNPKAGDLVLYKFSGSNRINHIGILKCVNKDGTISVYEGNTSTGNDANGGEVMLRVRPTTYVAGYCRPDYDEYVPTTTISKASTDEDIKWLQTKLNNALNGSNGFIPLLVDSSYGNKTKAAVINFYSLQGWKTDGTQVGKCAIGRLAKY